MLWPSSSSSVFSFFLSTALLIAQALWIWRLIEMTCQCAHCLWPQRKTSTIPPVINCRGEIIEMFVYQVAGSSPSTSHMWLKTWSFSHMHKNNHTGFWQQQFSQAPACRIAGVLLPSSQMGLGVKCHQVQFSLEIQWLKAKKEAALDVGLIKPYFVLKCLSERES